MDQVHLNGGLRQRKKLATRRSIVDSALALFEQRGFHATSIPAIAEAANVSPRTVSYYFPAKEQIVLAETRDRSLRLEQWLRERDPGQTTADAFRAWLAVELPQALAVDRDEQVRRRRVIDADLDLQAAERRYLAGAERALSEAFAADPGAPTPLHARMSAAALLALFGVVVTEGDARMADSPDRDASQDVHLLDDALQFVEAGLNALQSRDARSSATPDSDTRGS